MDLQNLTEIIPLIEEFELRYSYEIDAINELQDEIGVNFTQDTTEDPDTTE
jgi:hypothetical protein